MTGVVLLKLLNSAIWALEMAVGSETQMDPGGWSKGRFLAENYVSVKCGLSAKVEHRQDLREDSCFWTCNISLEE